MSGCSPIAWNGSKPRCTAFIDWRSVGQRSAPASTRRLDLLNSVVWSRFPHMLLASYLTGAFCVAASGAWYLLRYKCHAEAMVMLRSLFLAAVLVPVQLVFGHLVGDYVHEFQPAKFAAIEGRWHDEQPAGEVLLAWPDEANETNRYEIKIPVLGSIIGSLSLTSKEVGLTDFPPQDRPPVLIPFATFRIMVGCGLIMLALAWLGSYLSIKRRLERSRLVLWSIFLSFPLPFIAILTGWYTAEVGRQPWTLYGVLRTDQAMTPFLTAPEALTSLILFGATYLFIFSFGTFYLYRLLRAGPARHAPEVPHDATPGRPMSLADEHVAAAPSFMTAGE
jgi:cytochrome d ubiquinol oxidase subunit I